MASQITDVLNVCSIVYSGTDQRKHQSSASLALVRGIHRWPVNSPHKEPVTWKMFPFDDVIIAYPKGRGVRCIMCIESIISVAVKSLLYDMKCHVKLGHLTPEFVTVLNTSDIPFQHKADFTWASWCFKSLSPQVFVQQVVKVDINENIKILHYLTFLRGIHWRLDTPHKWPVMQKQFPCHDIIMNITIYINITLCWPYLVNYHNFYISVLSTSLYCIYSSHLYTNLV